MLNQFRPLGTPMHKSDANARLKFRNEPPKSGLVFWPWVLTYFKKIENDVLFSNDTGILGKRNPSSPNRSRTYDLPITSSD